METNCNACVIITLLTQHAGNSIILWNKSYDEDFLTTVLVIMNIYLPKYLFLEFCEILDFSKTMIQCPLIGFFCQAFTKYSSK